MSEELAIIIAGSIAGLSFLIWSIREVFSLLKEQNNLKKILEKELQENKKSVSKIANAEL